MAVPGLNSQAVKEFLAEFLGTAVLMIFGMGSVAQLVLSEGKTGSPDQVRWSWGLGVTFGVYVAGGVTGGHLNPAVTLTMCLFKRLPWSKLVPYFLGQYLGSFTASCLVYLVYYDAIHAFTGGNYTLDTAGIFSTYPQSYLSTANGLGDQIFGTAVLVLLVLALTDPGNMVPAKGYVPLLVGLVVVAIGMTFSQNCGYAINPARDLAPRFFTFIAGWGSQVFSINNYRWFWIPVLGPHIGAILGGAVYEACINLQMPCLRRAGDAYSISDGVNDAAVNATGADNVKVAVDGRERDSRELATCADVVSGVNGGSGSSDENAATLRNSASRIITNDNTKF